MASHTLHVVQAFEEKDGGIVPVEPKSCPSATSARALAGRLAHTRVGVIAWSRTGDPDLGDRLLCRLLRHRVSIAERLRPNVNG